MARLSILIVDDDLTFSSKLKAILDGIFDVTTCSSVAQFHGRFIVGKFDLIIMDVRLEKGREGLDLLRGILAQDAGQAVIVMTAYSDTESHADALQLGALTYLDKNELPPALIARTVEAIAQQSALRRQVVALERRLEPAEPLEIIAISRDLREAVRLAAERDTAPVLVVAEAGTGTEVIASNIHRFSRRRSRGPFVIGNCARLSAEAFHDAAFGTFRRLPDGKPLESKGWIDEAKGGTLLVDGLTAINTGAQRQLATLFETRTFLRGNRIVQADVQMIFSVTENGTREPPDAALPKLIRSANGTEIRILPLRERVEDVPSLANYTLQNLYREGRTQVRAFQATALSLLEALPWPGNLRELKSAVEYAAIRADATGVQHIGPEHLPQSFSEVRIQADSVHSSMDYQLNLARAEVALLESAILRLGTRKKSELADVLRYADRFIFARRMRRHLSDYPTIQREFPNVAELFGPKRVKR